MPKLMTFILGLGFASLAQFGALASNVYDVQISGQLLGEVTPTDVVIQAISPNDPFYNQQLSLRRLNIHQAWDITTGSGLVIAVIDTGVNRQHDDLSSKIWVNTDEIAGNGIDDDGNGYIDDIYGYNFYQNNSNIADGHGHGTGIASIIAANTNNGLGLAGINWSAKIMALKALDNLGGGDFDDVARAIRYAVDNGAKIINMSFGSNTNSVDLASAVDYAISKNVVIVAASGNNSDNQIYYPARYPQVIAVGSVNYQNTISAFSNYGANLDVMAPGENVIMAGLSAKEYVEGAGSSFAAAQISGLASLLLSHQPNLTATQVQNIINDTARSLVSDYNTQYGHGLADAVAALKFQAAPSVTNLTASSTSAAADGQATIQFSATVSDSLGRVLSNVPVNLSLTGSNNLVNGQLVAFGQNISLGQTDASGRIAFTLVSTTAETKTLQLLAANSGATLTQPLNVNFTAVNPIYRMQWVKQSPYPTLALGQEATLWVEVKNTGNITWTGETNGTNDFGQIRLGTDRSKDRTSNFYHSSWLSTNRVVTMTPVTVAPNQTATFAFKIKASQTGSFREYFGVVAERVTWLNDLGIYWDINVTKTGSVDAPSQIGTPTQVNQDPAAYQAIVQAKTADITLRAGELSTVSVSLRNTGSALWLSQGLGAQHLGEVRLGTTVPQDRASILFGPSWLSHNRVTPIGFNVPPNSNLDITFTVRAPSTPGVYTETFQLVSEYITWFGPKFQWVITVI